MSLCVGGLSGICLLRVGCVSGACRGCVGCCRQQLELVIFEILKFKKFSLSLQRYFSQANTDPFRPFLGAVAALSQIVPMEGTASAQCIANPTRALRRSRSSNSPR